MYVKKTNELLKWFLLSTNVLLLSCKRISSSESLNTSRKNSLDIEFNGNISDKYKCLSPGCEDAAKKIIANIDTKQEPCKDFYKFACGNFIDLSTIPDGKSTFNYITVVQEKVQQDLRRSLEGEVNSTEPKIYQLIKTYYKACMLNSSDENAKSLEHLKSIIKELGGWPVVDGHTWDESTFEWTHVDSMLNRVGFSPQTIVNIYVFNDPRKSIKQLLYVDPFLPYLKAATLSRSFSDPVVSAYEDFFINTATYLGAKKKRAVKEANAAIMFEKKLLEASKVQTEKKIKIERIKDLETHVPGIPWREYINNMTEPIIHLKKSQKIYVRNPSYFLNLKALLKKTPKRTVANYMIWRFIADSVPYITEEMRKAKGRFDRDSGKAGNPERWEECMKMVTKKSGLIVGASALYVREHFDQRARAAVTPVLYSISEEAKALMANYTWLDETSRIKAMRKADFMVKIIAYPNELFDEEIINNYVSPLSLSESNNYQNFLYLNRFHFNCSLGRLLDNFDSRMWMELSDTTVPNAYYFNIYNAFSVLAAVLQPPIFNPEWPNTVLFGSVGFIIGHEIMHAFDLKNIAFDESGSYSKWVSKEDLKVLESKAKCFRKQYDEYEDEFFKIKINGKQTLNENLADNLGMRITVGAYKRWLTSNGREIGLPGLDYSAEQIFWLSAVSFMCSKKREDQLMNDLLFNAHTPDNYRVIGTLQNSVDFANVFNCSLGSPMNPKKKCVLY